MHLMPNVDMQEFLDAVAACEGDVIFETVEGDAMNLKSQLCRYVFNVNAGKSFRTMHGEVTCKNPADAERLAAYLTE